MANLHRTTRTIVHLALTLALAASGACAPDAIAPDAKRPLATQHAAAVASPSNHDVYAARSIQCATCHPCGTRVSGGHAADWMDTASAGFHAFSADRDLASCQSCHGPALDGVGGTIAVSCAQCHGAGWTTNCTLCHGGTDSQTGAPPRTVWGQSADAVRVGAHTAHLAGTHGLGVAPCATCHVVPTDALSPGHANGATADVTFSGLALPGGGATPTWTRASATCANTYCHGATLSGGTLKSPAWTQADGTARACGACHGAPPPPPHSTSPSCGSCHSGYTATSVNLSLHMNGKIEATSPHAAGWAAKAQHGYTVNRTGLADCKTCHGANLDGVGGSAQGCATCHASANISSWSTNCTFCHGDRTSGTVSPPVDTQGVSTVASTSVGAHAAHVGTTLMSGMACTQCHKDRTGSNVITDAAHIDGDGIAEVDFGALVTTGGAAATYTRTSATQASCAATWCHGNFSGGANATMSWTTPGKLDCTSCHGAPPAVNHPQSADCGTCHPGYTATGVNQALHIDGKIDASSPHAAGWAAKAQHGYTVNRTGLADCKTCHGANLDGVGGSAQGCATCHASAGITSWNTNCTFCHGDRTSGRTSPPVDTQGGTAVTSVPVGVHAAHVGTTLMSGMTCTQCHKDRTGSNVITDAAHIDGNGVAEVDFGALVTTGAAAATYTRTSATQASCAATWCHGNFSGGANATVSWTTAGKLGCTSCHGAPPAAGHPQNTACGNCHGTGYSLTTVNAATHINGVVDVLPQTCTSCHGKAGQTATAASPLNAAPPTDTAGASTGVHVGAHQKHLVGGTYSNAIACKTCHANVGTYTTAHANGVSNVGFTGAANANLQKGTWVAPTTTTAAGSCSATWCHGAVINRTGGISGGTATVPSWTGTVTTCTACHGITRTTLPNGHTRSDHAVACSVCHGTGYSSTAVNKATHVDGVKTIVTVTTGTGIRSWNATTRSCTPSCHSAKTW